MINERFQKLIGKIKKVDLDIHGGHSSPVSLMAFYAAHAMNREDAIRQYLYNDEEFINKLEAQLSRIETKFDRELEEYKERYKSLGWFDRDLEESKERYERLERLENLLDKIDERTSEFNKDLEEFGDTVILPLLEEARVIVKRLRGKTKTKGK